MIVVLHSYMGHTLTICGVRRIEQDHMNYYVWYSKKLTPEIISKKAGVLTIHDTITELTDKGGQNT